HQPAPERHSLHGDSFRTTEPRNLGTPELHHSSRMPMRNDRGPEGSRSDTSPTPLMTPTCASELMFVAGFDQFGWFKKFVAVSSQRSRSRPPRSKCFAKPTSHTSDPGPLMTPLAAVPKEPGVGGPNAVGSNHRLGVRSDAGRLGSCNRFGRIVAWAGV